MSLSKPMLNTKGCTPFIISVEGIIATGKSTLINDVLVPHLKRRGYRVAIVHEPVELWGEILVEFYNNPKRWAYHFQSKAYHDRVMASIKIWEEFHESVDIIITDRSVISDMFFMNLLYKDGNVTKMEYNDYLSWWSMWDKIVPFQPNLFIYLDTPIDKCMKQVQLRNREGESSVSESYQLGLKLEHDLFFNSDDVPVKGKLVPVYQLHTDIELRDLSETVIDEIVSYIL